VQFVHLHKLASAVIDDHSYAVVSDSCI